MTHYEYMKLDDLIHLDIREVDLDALNKSEDWFAGILDRIRSGYAYTVFHNDEVMACCGVMHISNGVAEIWTVTGRLVDEHPFAFHKISKEIVKEALEINSLHRLQCVVDANYKKSIKWLKSLGFEEEGLLRKYSAQAEDYYIYSIVREV
jgi:RimJ/RimL family protein N-acetyltransferase